MTSGCIQVSLNPFYTLVDLVLCGEVPLRWVQSHEIEADEKAVLRREGSMRGFAEAWSVLYLPLLSGVKDPIWRMLIHINMEY